MLHFNLYPNKMLAGCFASLAALICDNLLPLFITIIVFELMDFFTGCLKSAVLAKRAGGKFAFESVKAWRTIYKLVFILIGVVLPNCLTKRLRKKPGYAWRIGLPPFVVGLNFGHFWKTRRSFPTIHCSVGCGNL